MATTVGESEQLERELGLVAKRDHNVLSILVVPARPAVFS